MAKTRKNTAKGASKEGSKGKGVAPAKKAKVSMAENSEEEETAYERLLRKVNDNRERRNQSPAVKKMKKVAQDSSKAVTVYKRPQATISRQIESSHTRFEEENNFVDMGVTGLQQEFPSDEDMEMEGIEVES